MTEAGDSGLRRTTRGVPALGRVWRRCSSTYRTKSPPLTSGVKGGGVRGVWGVRGGGGVMGVRGTPQTRKSYVARGRAKRAEARGGLVVHTQGGAYTRWSTHKAVHTQGGLWPLQVRATPHLGTTLHSGVLIAPHSHLYAMQVPAAPHPRTVSSQWRSYSTTLSSLRHAGVSSTPSGHCILTVALS